MTTVTRFPPSPTGDLHLGSARTALFNWLYAKQTGGELTLRIEDTDRERSTPEAVAVIFDGLKWLGIDWQQGPVYQSERAEVYAATIQKLLADGNAYYCTCSRERLDASREALRAAGKKPRYDRHCRELNLKPAADEAAVVRFKNPLTGAVTFDDVVRGRVTIDNDELDDLIIARSDGGATYNLSVVVDDMEMNITHVIRGDDHINNTPRQINIFTALGATPPVFAHLPLIAGNDGKRLSKRHGAVSVLIYREMGILPEALLNYLARLGWSHGDREIFSLDEMIALFDINAINKSMASFDLAKLLSVNQHYLREADRSRLAEELRTRLQARDIDPNNGPDLAEVAEVMAERARTLEEMTDKITYLYADVTEYDAKASKKHFTPESAKLLSTLLTELQSTNNWTPDEITTAINTVLETTATKLGNLAQPLRVAVSGTAATPPIETTLNLLGKPRTLERIENAVRWIEG